MNTTKRQLQALIRKDERYAAIAETAAAITHELVRGFRDSAAWVSGWGHTFVCTECAAHLQFDPALDYRPGENVFVCPSCGAKASGETVGRVWVYYYRITYAEKLEAAAVCALLGDHDALDFLTRYFDFYADTYAGFAPHTGDDCRPKEPSKLMPQLLDEAVWCTYVLRALYPCRALFPAEKLQTWKEKLFRPMAEVIANPKYNSSIHNHVLWHMSAVGIAALTFDDDALMYAIDGEWGIRRQVKEGFTEEGFWFECSQLYHYYALEALTGFCQILADKHPADPLLSTLETAYTVPMLTSHDGWHIPSMNDGWYPLTLARFAGQLHRAAACTASPVLEKQLDAVRRREPALLDRPCALLLETAPAVTAAIPGAKMAIIREPVFAVLKSGVVCRSHR
ncbi:MAG: alginate lyase family protein, partial [Clostridia bacterium]|nr:alginate lyase family protein [Clostridia bacterium]